MVPAKGMLEARTRKIILSSVATHLGMAIDEVATRLNNKERVVPAPTQGVDKTDAGIAEYLQMEKEVNTAMAEQEKTEE